VGGRRERHSGQRQVEDEEPAEQLARLPDLAAALREAPPAIKRQVFQSLDVQIAYDKAEHRVELTATLSEAVANASRTQKPSRRRARAWS